MISVGYCYSGETNVQLDGAEYLSLVSVNLFGRKFKSRIWDFREVFTGDCADRIYTI